MSFCAAVRATAGDRARLAGWGGLVLLAALLAACASSGTALDVEPATRLSEKVSRFLINPMRGYELSVSAEDAVRLDRGFDALLNRGDAEFAFGTAQQLLARDDRLEPAVVLAEQVAFVAGNYSSVVDRLIPLVEIKPGYLAASLLLARSQELMGDEVEAFAHYRLSISDPVASSRMSRLAPRVRTQLVRALEEAVAANDEERSRMLADRLRDYFPQSVESLVAQRDVAQAWGDSLAELEARRELAAARAPDRQALRRLAELEVEVGDPTQGVEILQRLLDQSPSDFEMREELDAAKFSWRLNMLPPEVAVVVRADTLTRADFATLLYWVVPGVRSGGAQAARIATDISLDHPHRREVVRVLNLGLMPMSDPSLREFSPEELIDTATALDVLLRVPRNRGVNTACAATYVKQVRRSVNATCETAVRCGIIDATNSCVADGPLSGAAAREMVRRTLNVLGGTRRDR